ncbi:hypothetical protein WN48_07247 [Eufriesea mexicana]|uniref:Uncharacterized protein n=1 Tax=Eufriesea mexicana TaxID=516756 RepID=A0A310SR49_9HYME|nr:PREDICTED: uncharacterized protein LOC108550970 [Eufriesea mexicana]XP_017760447.1 PREDICTED: uncharacterized protein LOC108550970 [Eufriesea mexicana]XP_017760456.1 PREDICTED: uncharacterized protein LOC108550970 [Eufriesea mexicana]XP_017760463.1 PREDICTED: uncharacterized protein LOC108550970 [Eufriesea mexicana]XP_017760471.1 PREDICTED: uncharacterized protein LOC108550970 [Eufriesea mexicana]XP_017760479.1 PREDICTED: uncharacterized protein LOC108550970 [Eufriesea mexicana]XP_01776048
MTDRYESPEVKIVLTKEEIHKRYQDAALTIFQEQQSKKEEVVNYLTFGTSRRTMEYSNYGNHPVIVRRPTGSLVTRNDSTISSQILRIYRKPRDSCAIN